LFAYIYVYVFKLNIVLDVSYTVQLLSCWSITVPMWTSLVVVMDGLHYSTLLWQVGN